MNSVEVLRDGIKVAAEMGGRKTTRLSPKSAGIGPAAYWERGGIGDL